MCDLGISAIITSVVATVISTVTSSVMAAQQAEAQNKRNRMAQEAAANEQAHKMKALAEKELQQHSAAAMESDQDQRASRVAIAESENVSSEANIGGRSINRLSQQMRAKRLEGVFAMDKNLANLRSQALLDHESVNAQFNNRNNSLQWASADMAIASAVIDGVGGLAQAGMAAYGEWGPSDTSVIEANSFESAFPGAPGSGVLDSQFTQSPVPQLSNMEWGIKPGPWKP